MITLKESILSDMEDTMSVGEVDAAKAVIDGFISNNYYPVKYTVSKKPNKDGKYVVNSRGNVRLHRTAKSITNDIFVWGKCNIFECNDNEYITNLIGAPRKVVAFYCKRCPKLESLEGCPEELDIISMTGSGIKNLIGLPSTYDDDIDCAACHKLESLEGCPQIVSSVNVSNCYNLQTLKGGPKKVYDSFDCSYCTSLKSLEGAPNVVDRNFRCVNCHGLTSFKGAPKKIGVTFNGTGCVSVRTLDIPYMTIGRNFVISCCKNLTSLEGAPKKIDDSAECDKCYSVRSLKGLPDNMESLYMKENSINTLDGCPKVINIIDLHNVGETPLFTVDEIRAISGAKHVII
jgi:hypothetical protein